MDALRQFNDENQSQGNSQLRITLPSLSLAGGDGASLGFGRRIQSALGLQTNEEREAGETARWCPSFSLSYFQRIMCTVGLMATGILIIMYLLLTFPVQILHPRKFVLTYTLGSVACLLSFSFYSGPLEHIKHLLSPERRVFTAAYIGSLVLTLYAAMVLKYTSLTLLSALVQVSSFLYYALSYVPGGTAGLTMCFSTVVGSARNTLPV